MITALILIPTVAGITAFLLPWRLFRRRLLVMVAVCHAMLTALSWHFSQVHGLTDWLALDALGHLFLTMVSALFLAVALYTTAYLRREEHSSTNESESIFIGCMLFFLATMTLVTTSQHLGLLWVGIEATTLASAPMIYFHRSKQSLEATWKYLLICSVGIALAMLGNFFFAGAGKGGESVSLLVNDIVAVGKRLSVPWIKAGFICLLVGYGTKMGLAPLHTWLPDAHSEAPSPVSALLSGALLNCAFLGILRGIQVCNAAGLDIFARNLMLGFGIFSMLISAIFLIRSSDYKRMLAYSSVEHMGILSVGIGIGGLGAFGAIFHAINHSLAKGLLFLAAGNIIAGYGTKSVERVQGLLRSLPITGFLWLAGFLAITGSPPFGTFLSEFTILRAGIQQGRMIISVLYLSFLAIAFVGMSGTFIRMAQGRSENTRKMHETPIAIVVPMLLGAAVLLFGLFVPHGMRDAIEEAARVLEVTP